MFLRSQSLSRCFLQGRLGLVLMLTKHSPRQPGREKQTQQAMLAFVLLHDTKVKGFSLYYPHTAVAAGTQPGVSRRRTGYPELLQNKLSMKMRAYHRKLFFTGCYKHAYSNSIGRVMTQILIFKENIN